MNNNRNAFNILYLLPHFKFTCKFVNNTLGWNYYTEPVLMNERWARRLQVLVRQVYCLFFNKQTSKSRTLS